MAALEIENFTFPPGPRTTAAENFAALEPAYKEEFIRCWYAERFAVGFITGNGKGLGKSTANRMVFGDIPNPDLFPGLPPAEQMGICSHQGHKRL